MHNKPDAHRCSKLEYSRVARSRLSSKKWGEGESLITFAGKVVSFLAPGSVSTDLVAKQKHVYEQRNCQLANELTSTDYPIEKQFSDKGVQVQRVPKIKVHCSWFVGPSCSPYFAAPSLLVKKTSVVLMLDASLLNDNYYFITEV